MTADARLLADHTVALGMAGELRLVSRLGETLWSLPIDGGTIVVVKETRPGELAVGVIDVRRMPAWRTVIVDAAGGAVLREIGGLLPLRDLRPGAAQDRPDSFGARLFLGDNGSLVRLEPDGQKRVVVAGVE